MSDSELAEHYLKWDAPQMAGIDMDYFRRHGYFHLAVGTPDDRLPHANGNFPTPSGKVEFLVKDAKNFVAPPFRMMYEQMQSGEDVDPLPGYMPPRESVATNPRLADRYPLNVISPKSHGFLNSCYANEKHKIKGQGEQFVMISPRDAAARAIREGDPVRVYNDRGDFEGLARVTDDVREGVVVATLGYWRSPQPLRRVGELDLVGRVLQPWPRADLLRQFGPGHARELRPVFSSLPRREGLLGSLNRRPLPKRQKIAPQVLAC